MPKNGAELAMSLQKRKRKTSADEDGESESLSDVDDRDVSRYINSKPEMIFKKLVWEAMNKDYGKGKTQQKWVSRLKTSASDKKTASNQKEVVPEKRLSSKINYAALNSLRSELEEVTEEPEEQSTEEPEGDNFEEGDKSGELSPEEDNHEEGDNSGESEQDDDYNEEDDATINYGYGDEEGGYGDWNDYGYEEY